MIGIRDGVAAALALTALASVGYGLWRLYENGVEHGREEVQTKWDKAAAAAEQETKRIREEGFALAAEYESTAHELERRHASTTARFSAQLRSARVQCPASGQLGDVVVPAAVIDGMFYRGASTVRAPGPSTGQPDGAVH